MKPAFLTPLECRYVTPWTFKGVWHENNGVDHWELTTVFQYRSVLLRRVVEAPIGFRFDKASVPDLLSVNFAGRFTRAACIHDYLLQYMERKKADRVFLEAMRAEIDEEILAMKDAGIDDDEIVSRKGALEGRAQAMYAAVALATKLNWLLS